MKRVILLGPPGVGKGTQSRILANWLKVPHISTGEILRASVEKADELGLRVKSYLDNGELVPDELMLSVIEDSISSQFLDGWILDGFPRNLSQARSLDYLLEKLHQHPHLILSLNASIEILVDRLLERGTLEGRSDDDLNVINKRMQIYHQQTVPLLDFYKGRPAFASIDGDKDREEVTREIISIISPQEISQ